MIFFRTGAADLHPPAHEARIPDGVRVYAIGDIHGRADLFASLLDRIAADAADANVAVRLVCLGDFIDRGEQSREVIDRLASGRLPWPFDCLRGNHEAMALACIDGMPGWTGWLANGGVETLFSYGLDVRDLRGARALDAVPARFLDALPSTHLAFLRGLSPSLSLGDYFFCHAGVRPGVPLERQSVDDLLWIRQDFLASPLFHGKRIVHGHTPVFAPEVLPNRINVDTGAFLTNRLSCAVLEGSDVRILST